MPMMSTNFAWKHEYDVKLWRHKKRTPNTNDHHNPLNDPPMKIFCVRHWSSLSFVQKTFDCYGWKWLRVERNAYGLGVNCPPSKYCMLKSLISRQTQAQFSTLGLTQTFELTFYQFACFTTTLPSF